ncbi:hypothetical protein DLAC_11431 [Tieghemostelium lacteum]|uniref:WD repeat-containing protein 75 second beta-propeller domain-containing protein n=1 Tax=Tieghemostelium lacteum TaxID=361077 RepID=A0A152A9A5_TIELA|nr:hypothetical protein DLAC_11431 [Tieghemostelium lacteum]|eukprot:KYR02647.1 hypothetical protein DLAC_11431 [Tieghemostelium lacteum]
MNIGLFDPFRMQDIPDTVEDYLMDSINSKANCCAFNRRGSFLAVGSQQGQISIWDFDTKSIGRLLISHKQCVNYVCWTRNGKNLLSVSNDGSLVLWDLADSKVEKKLEMELALLFVQVHPRDSRYALICSSGIGVPLLVNLESENLTYEPIFDPSSYKGDLNLQGVMTASFNRKGTKIYIGDSHGMVNVVDWKSRAYEKSFKGSSASVKGFQFSRNGKMVLVNSNDKVLRLYSLPQQQEGVIGEYSLLRDFSDNVNRVQWKSFGFSYNNEYVYGGMSHKSIQSILVWNTSGGIVKGLEGPKEGLLDVTWHPYRPIIVSLSYSGIIYIWSCYYTENWSSFAPDFQELEENEEYIEREDEFDHKSDDDDEKDKKQNGQSNSKDNEEDVDILSIDKMDEYSSDEEEEILVISSIPE